MWLFPVLLGHGSILSLTRRPPATWLVNSQNASSLCTHSTKRLNKDKDIPLHSFDPLFSTISHTRLYYRTELTRELQNGMGVGGREWEWFVSFCILIKAFLPIQKQRASKKSNFTKNLLGYPQFLIFCSPVLFAQIFSSNPYFHVNFYQFSRKLHVLPRGIHPCSGFIVLQSFNAQIFMLGKFCRLQKNRDQVYIQSLMGRGALNPILFEVSPPEWALLLCSSHCPKK